MLDVLWAEPWSVKIGYCVAHRQHRLTPQVKFAFPPVTISLCLPPKGLSLLLHFASVLPVSLGPSVLLLFRTRALIEHLSHGRKGRSGPDKHLSSAGTCPQQPSICLRTDRYASETRLKLTQLNKRNDSRWEEREIILLLENFDTLLSYWG